MDASARVVIARLPQVTNYADNATCPDDIVGEVALRVEQGFSLLPGKPLKFGSPTTLVYVPTSNPPNKPIRVEGRLELVAATISMALTKAFFQREGLV